MEKIIKISSVNDIDTYLKEINSPLLQHVSEEGRFDIASYSVQQLEDELTAIPPIVKDDRNYVPEFFGGGLISRALSILQDNFQVDFHPDFCKPMISHMVSWEMEFDDLCNYRFY